MFSLPMERRTAKAILTWFGMQRWGLYSGGFFPENKQRQKTHSFFLEGRKKSTSRKNRGVAQWSRITLGKVGLHQEKRKRRKSATTTRHTFFIQGNLGKVEQLEAFSRLPLKVERRESKSTHSYSESVCGRSCALGRWEREEEREKKKQFFFVHSQSLPFRVQEVCMALCMRRFCMCESEVYSWELFCGDELGRQ